MPLLLLLQLVLLLLLLLLLQTTLLLCKFLLLLHGLKLLLELRNTQALSQHEASTLINIYFKTTVVSVNFCSFCYSVVDYSALVCKNKPHTVLMRIAQHPALLC